MADVGLIDAALRSLAADEAIVAATDTVYGLFARSADERGVARIWELKGRPPGMPCALVGADVEAIVEAVPELAGEDAFALVARALLPGPFTLVLANPAGRLPWLAGSRPQTIGVRVPRLPESTAQVLRRAGALAATSANLHGGPDPRRLADVPTQIRDSVAVAMDAGDLPGVPSTVVDLSGPEPLVLREGAVAAAEALERIGAALR